jgi:Putative beta-barrel porin-2, OmpL-like. bbp2
MHSCRFMRIGRFRNLCGLKVGLFFALVFAASARDAVAAEHRTPPPSSETKEPFAFADFTWLTGNPRTTESPFDTPVFTPEFRADVSYHHDFARPRDNTISGSSEVFRSNEVQVTMLGVGGDFHWKNVRGRVICQFGLYSQTTPRNGATPARGQWQLADAFR